MSLKLVTIFCKGQLNVASEFLYRAEFLYCVYAILRCYRLHEWTKFQSNDSSKHCSLHNTEIKVIKQKTTKPIFLHKCAQKVSLKHFENYEHSRGVK